MGLIEKIFIAFFPLQVFENYWSQGAWSVCIQGLDCRQDLSRVLLDIATY